MRCGVTSAPGGRSLAATRAVYAAAETDWPAVAAAARGRPDCTCSICLADTHAGAKPLTLLPCSHVFHHACVGAFEAFVVGAAAHLCPVCLRRGTYL